ncbi:MAG TPA: O-antigen ligase family protein [Bacteroidota bacterium]|nr:O-antigen ligase family protein [Bacteroidota bacterium]
MTPAIFPQKMTLAGLYLFAFGLPFSFVPAEFGLGLALLGWLLEGLFNKNWQITKHPIFIPLGIYIAWNFFSSIISPRPLHSLWADADNEWPLFIMVMMFCTIKDKKTLVRLFTIFCISALVAMLYAIFQTFAGIDFVHPHAEFSPMGKYYRAVGFNGFYLTFGAFAMSVFFLAANVWLELQEKSRWLFGAVALLCFAAIIGTFARSMWLSLFVAVPAFGFIRGKKLGTIITTSFFILAIAAVIFVPTIQDRAASVFDLKQNETRINLWKTSIKIFHDFPITGIGEDNFDYYVDAYKVPGFYDTTAHPHSDYLNVLVNSGIIGIITFFSVWVIAIYTGYKTWKKSADPMLRGLAMGGTLAILGFMVGSCFQDYYGTFANCFHWWFATGFLFTAHHLSFLEEKKLQQR